MNKHQKNYINSFGDNLTDEQINILKDSFGYALASLADATEELGKAIINSMPKWIKKLMGQLF